MRDLLASGAIVVGGSVALSLIAKATVVTSCAIAASWLARRRRAAVRHLIFVAAFVTLALLPAASAVLPAFPISIRLASVPVMRDVASAAMASQPAEGPIEVSVRPTESFDRTGARPALSTATLLNAVWLVGVICCLTPVALGLWQVRRVRDRGLPWHSAQMMTDDLARNAGFSRPIDVMVHEAIASPITCGVARAAIFFPPDARTWSVADVRRALTHELEHVRRGDWITLCLARVICAAYWFHPLVWIANRQLLVNAERACDDAVLRESQAFGYADQLVTLAERTLAQTNQPLLAMASRGDLTTRVRAVLDPFQQRGPAGNQARIAGAIGAVVAIAWLAPLRPVAAAREQTPAEARPQFAVASIKPYVGDGIMHVRPLPGRLTAEATLQILMQYAYGLQAFQVAGGPNWLTTDRYEVEAKADGVSSRDQLFVMLQSLLEDRFHLKTHRELKELPVFALVSNRSGLKLPAPTEDGCVESVADAALEWTGGRMPVPGELPGAKSRCGSAIAVISRLVPAEARLSGGKIAMSEFARVLSMVLGRRVIDNTGVVDLFDVQLDFVPDETTPTMPSPPPGTPISGVTITTALQQQLGLRLESRRGPVEVIVVDEAERPSN
jgi:uncharacterized protein (TIGR03435 family)